MSVIIVEIDARSTDWPVNFTVKNVQLASVRVKSIEKQRNIWKQTTMSLRMRIALKGRRSDANAFCLRPTNNHLALLA